MEDEAVSSAMERVVPVPGDLSRPLLGLDDSDFKASILPRNHRAYLVDARPEPWLWLYLSVV